MNFMKRCLECEQPLTPSVVHCPYCGMEQMKDTNCRLGSRSREWLNSENVGDQITAKYRKGNLILEISGVIYRYIDVPRHIYEELIEDESPLTYYKKYIKDKYDEEEVY